MNEVDNMHLIFRRYAQIFLRNRNGGHETYSYCIFAKVDGDMNYSIFLVGLQIKELDGANSRMIVKPLSNKK